MHGRYEVEATLPGYSHVYRKVLGSVAKAVEYMERAAKRGYDAKVVIYDLSDPYVQRSYVYREQRAKPPLLPWPDAT
jgi:hypothetical protein